MQPRISIRSFVCSSKRELISMWTHRCILGLLVLWNLTAQLEINHFNHVEAYRLLIPGKFSCRFKIMPSMSKRQVVLLNTCMSTNLKSEIPLTKAFSVLHIFTRLNVSNFEWNLPQRLSVLKQDWNTFKIKPYIRQDSRGRFGQEQ